MNDQEAYLLLCFEHLDDLEAAVNTHMQRGYTPLGAPYLCLRGPERDASHVQALIRVQPAPGDPK